MSQGALNAIMIVEIVISVFFIVAVLLQNRAEGLGKMFGGGGEVFRMRRGLEKVLFYITIGLAVVWCILSFIIVKFTV